jgi:transcriptional regulator with XRE-family HTH domain
VAENSATECNTLTQRVASEIRAELGRRQLSQSDLGQILGIHRTQISKRLQGRELSFTTAELDLIAGALGIPVDRLLGAPMAVAA